MTATIPVSWPTEETFKRLNESFATAFNELEGLVGYLRHAVDHDDAWPTPAPTFGTVGVLWNALDDIRANLDQLTRESDELEKLLDEVNAIRRDWPAFAKEAVDVR